MGVAAALVLTGCGGDDDDAADGGAGDAGDADVQTLTVTSSDALKFDPDQLSATAGEVRIVHENGGATTHTFVLENTDFKLVDDDDDEIDLAAGDYVFYCDVPGHRDAGMEGTLTVTP